MAKRETFIDILIDVRVGPNKYLWMCGCFVCLLSNELKPSPWINTGVDDLRHEGIWTNVGNDLTELIKYVGKTNTNLFNLNLSERW